MELQTAVHLIQKGVDTAQIQTWTDLGAGLFTNALSQLLPKGSSIIAIDKTKSKIEVADGIHLITKVGDFTKIDIGKTDGILMANSLHYVKEQKEFLSHLTGRRIIIVEYDTDRSNPWVPYPVGFKKLQSMFNTTKLADTPSQYQTGGIYAALISF